MDNASALTAQLGALTNILDDPGTDLQAILAVLSDELSQVVASYIGLTMTQQFDGFEVSMSAIEAGSAGDARSSVQLPLDLPTAAEPACSVAFYASEQGAFVRLAADFQRVTGPDPRIILDGPRPDPLPKSGVSGLADLSAVNRAIGVLITRGYFPDEARAELHRRVGDGSDSVPDAARRVLLSTNTPRPRETSPVIWPFVLDLDRPTRLPMHR